MALSIDPTGINIRFCSARSLPLACLCDSDHWHKFPPLFLLCALLGRPSTCMQVSFSSCPFDAVGPRDSRLEMFEPGRSAAPGHEAPSPNMDRGRNDRLQNRNRNKNHNSRSHKQMRSPCHVITIVAVQASCTGARAFVIRGFHFWGSVAR